MYTAYKKFEAILHSIEKVMLVIPFFIVFVTVILQVFQREFNLPIDDTSDLSMICLTLFTFVGIGMLVYSQDHITIEVHKLIKNYKILTIIEVIMYLGLIAFSSLYLNLGYDLFAFALDVGTATTKLRIPLALPYGTMLFGFICVIIHSIGKLMDIFVNRKDLETFFNKEVDIENLR